MVYSGEKGFSLRFGSFGFFFVCSFLLLLGGCFWGRGGGFGSFVEIGLMIVEKIDRTFNCKNVLNVNKNLY